MLGFFEQAQAVADHLACGSIAPGPHKGIDKPVLVGGQRDVPSLAFSHT